MSLNLPVTTLVLERGDTGLGFNVRGGTDIPHVLGDCGIFVTRVKEEGAAFKDGRLKEGDKILEVNGKSVTNLTHNEAVQIFITAGNRVEMKVQRGAYAALMKRSKFPQQGTGKGMKYKIACVALTAVTVAGIGVFIYMRQQQQT